jgi:hypothetical protein
VADKPNEQGAYLYGLIEIEMNMLLAMPNCPNILIIVLYLVCVFVPFEKSVLQFLKYILIRTLPLSLVSLFRRESSLTAGGHSGPRTQIQPRSFRFTHGCLR